MKISNDGTLNSEFEKAIKNTGNQPVILCSSPIRLIFRRLIERTYPQIAIMSYNEVTNNVKLKTVGIIRANSLVKWNIGV